MSRTMLMGFVYPLGSSRVAKSLGFRVFRHESISMNSWGNLRQSSDYLPLEWAGEVTLYQITFLQDGWGSRSLLCPSHGWLPSPSFPQPGESRK